MISDDKPQQGHHTHFMVVMEILTTTNRLYRKLRATLYACSMPCQIQLFFEKLLREIRNSMEIFQKIIEFDKA